jgi:hypothetical protein
LVYKETVHSLGGATETGVAKVTIFMEVVVSLPLAALLLMGAANDHTGMEMGGGGGMEGDAKAVQVYSFLNTVDIVGGRCRRSRSKKMHLGGSA